MGNNHTYTIKAGDTLSEIALRFYGTCEDQLLEKLVIENNLKSKHLIIKGEPLTLPYYIPYGITEAPIKVDQKFLYVIKQLRHALPIEFHHSEFEGEPVAARRFIYCWKLNIPQTISPKLKKELFNKLESKSERDALISFYKVDTGNSSLKASYILDKSKIKDNSEKDKLKELLNKAKYNVWQNKGVLMTDDWGQPWRIKEYIDKCDRAGKFNFIASNYHEVIENYNRFSSAYLKFERNKGEAEKSNEIGILSNFGDTFSQKQYFAFYTPKEIDELHFIESYSKYMAPEESNNLGYLLHGYLDTREYFRPGEEYIFRFAPLDVLWARDEYVHMDVFSQEKIPDVGSSSTGNKLDFCKTILEKTNFRNIIEHKPNYYTSGDWNPEKMVDDGEALLIKIPEPSKGLYSDKAIVITLKPNFSEYISLLQKLNYKLEKGLNTIAKASAEITKTESVLGDLKSITELLGAYPTGGKFNDKSRKKAEEYISDIDESLEQIYENKKNLSHLSSIKAGIENAANPIPDDGNKALKLIDSQKSIFYTNINEQYEKIKALLEMPDYKNKVKEFYKKIGPHTKTVESDYFSFRKPCLTPLDTLGNTFLLVSMFPDEDIVNNFYNDYIEPFEYCILNEYKEKYNDFHEEVSKDIIAWHKDLKVEGEKIFQDSGRNCKFKTSREIMEDYIDDKTDYIEQLSKPKDDSLPAILWNIASNYLSWNNQAGADSIITKIIKVFTYQRSLKFFQGTRELEKVLALRDYTLGMAKMAKVYNGIKKGIYPGDKKIFKKDIINCYKAIIMSEKYKYFTGRNINLRDNIANTRNRILKDGRDIIKKFIENDKRGLIGKAPRWISSGFSLYQLSSSYLGIIDILGKDEEDKDEEETIARTLRDFNNLISHLSSGGLALTGISPRHLYKFLRKYSKFKKAHKLFNARKILLKEGTPLTITLYITSAIECGFEAAWNYKTGDHFLMFMNLTKIMLNRAGLSNYLIGLLLNKMLKSASKEAIKALITTFINITNLISIIIVVIMILISIGELVYRACLTGTQKVMEEIIKGVFKSTVEKLERGSYFIDETELFNLSSMWYINESNEIKEFPPISPYFVKSVPNPHNLPLNTEVKRVIKRYIFIAPIILKNKDKIYKFNILDFEPLDYRYSVPTLVFKNWPLESIIALHKSGWIKSHKDPLINEDEDDKTAISKIQCIYEYWNSVYSAALDGKEYYEYEVYLMKKLLREKEKINDLYYRQILKKGKEIIEERNSKLTK